VTLELVGVPFKHVVISPADWYHLAGPELKEGPTKRVIAKYDDGAWRTAAAEFTSITCRGPVTCHFEGRGVLRGDVRGPFRNVALVGTVMWADDLALARIAPHTGLWALLLTRVEYPSISWQPASSGWATRLG
jgi:hypothetical protein